MTSRRSEDNATTADWRSEKDGLYFDSTWSADSQGRKQPASTQITVTPSASILETSRAAQAANRERLDRRENEAKTEAEAVQKIKREEAEQKANKKEVTRGVPENKIRTVLPKRRGGAVFSWIVHESKEKKLVSQPTFNRLSVESGISASKNIKTLSSAFEVYRFYDPIEAGKPFELPEDFVTYDNSGGTASFPPPESLLSFNILQAKKDRLAFEVSATLEAYVEHTGYWVTRAPHTGTGGVNYYPEYQGISNANDWTQVLRWQIGLFFNSRKLSKSSFLYFFAKKKELENPTSLFQLRNVDEGFSTLASLDPESKYPQPTYISGDSAKIYIERIEFTPTFKKNAMENYSDWFGNPTQRRTFEWNRPGPYRIEGDIGSQIATTFTGIMLPTGFPGSGAATEAKIDTPVAVTFNDQIELIYTDKDYGELIWAE